MISLYSGTPGSGKSLDIARYIYLKNMFGFEFLCNFEIDTSKLRKYKGNFHYFDNSQLSPNFLRNFSDEYFKNHKFKEGQIILIIDECQLMFNSREWNAKGRNEWLGFFTNHRKYGYNIILVAQFDRMIDRQIRALIEYEYKHRKLSNYGFWGRFISFFSGGDIYLSICYWYPVNERIGSEMYHCRKKYYSLYDSYKRFDEVKTNE